LGISKKTYNNLFGEIPKRLLAGQIVDTDHYFEKLDEIMPHPVYGWMSWIGVLNPSKTTISELKPLIDESFELAKSSMLRKLNDNYAV
jgi:hypothetical protein